MKRLCYKLFVLASVSLLLFSTTGCKKGTKEQRPNLLTKLEIEDGWKLLFDGKSFAGWRGIGMEGIPKGHWLIEDQAIRKIASGDVPTAEDGQPLKGGDLLTRDVFYNFELRFEWKISKGGNSGIKYNVSEEASITDGAGRALGFEYQVLDDDGQTHKLRESHYTGSLYDLLASGEKILKPAGEYNSGRILYRDSTGEHWLNGRKVIEFDTESAKFSQLFQQSKYYKFSGFSKHKFGHIVLQDHGDDVWFRNIKIKILGD